MRTQTIFSSAPFPWMVEGVSEVPVNHFSFWQFLVVGKPMTYETQVLTRPNHVIVSELVDIPQVDALYAERDSEGVLMVFVVAEEHSEDIYQRVLEAEERICKTLKSDKIELRIRAHQGRLPRLAVPVGSRPLFVR